MVATSTASLQAKEKALNNANEACTMAASLCGNRLLDGICSNEALADATHGMETALFAKEQAQDDCDDAKLVHDNNLEKKAK